jgi:isfu1 transposase
LIGEVSGKRFARESFVAALCNKKILAPFCYQGTCNTALFNMWIELFLLPEIQEGQVVIVDNATFHKSEKTKQLIESKGCKVIFLPPYSPDLNPIEIFWANLKHKIKSIIHEFKTLQEAIDHVFRLYLF